MRKVKHIDNKRKTIELMLLFIYFIIVVAGSIYFKIGYILFTVIFAIFPSIYFCLRKKSIAKRLLIETFIVTIPVEVVVDYIAHVSHAWFVPSPLGIRIFGIIPIEDFIWTAMYIFFLISFYEYFFDGSVKRNFSKNFKYFVWILMLILFTFGVIFILNKDLLNISYFYLILMIIFIILSILAFTKYPKLYTKISLAILYLFIPSLLYEITALELGYWTFTIGNHIGYVSLFKYMIPIEEIMWYIVPPTLAFVVHEIFVDNKRN